MNAGVQKQNLTPTTEEQMENHQQRNGISKAKEKIESAYYQVPQIEINKRPIQFNLFFVHLIHRGCDPSDMEIVITEIRLQISYVM